MAAVACPKAVPPQAANAADFGDIPHSALPPGVESSLALAFASAIDMARSSARLVGRPGFGLAAEEFAALMERYFPGSKPVFPARAFGTRGGIETDEFDELVRLLLEYRVDGRPEGRWLAYAIAACCMGDDHLWQDMGLPHRQALSELLNFWFPGLATRNNGMRWKKFFYKQLCEREGVYVCRSPSCGVCSEYANCFGTEEEKIWQTA
ncbi:nitrogen fixation protein NifQ [Methylomagnum ishizawai]|uniref:Nitrogen fixation protein NifQ n=1 Tax=Methylomagnum ishizawai TaxID=1760988 RepID=A0A1Y6DAR9_9GAMM|nr:nitrogen fixation protein NifQ [Methylomagnum ishizawai]SMF97713.1 nitrogen fixation protein NifQ [Methylomagnum ishizawai]